jgi:hypothetical protein
MRCSLILALLATLLLGCGATADVTQTPEAIHARWIAAVRANDRAVALAVVEPGTPGREVLVDQALRTMQDLMTSPSSPTGALQRIDLQAPTNEGLGKHAISVWHFAKKTWCYEAGLTATAAGWRIISWGQIARCP